MSNEIQLSKRTLAILKNYASINPSIVLEQGKRIRTADAGQSILVQSEIDEEIPMKFPIMDLSAFLTILSLEPFKECTLSVHEKYIDIIGKKTSVQFWAAAKSMVELPGDELELPEGDIKCVIEDSMFHDFTRACSALGHEYCKIANKGGKVYLIGLSPDLDTSNNYTAELGITDLSDAELILKTSNLKLMAGDYQVEASSSDKFAKFTTMDNRINYLVGGEMM